MCGRGGGCGATSTDLFLILFHLEFMTNTIIFGFDIVNFPLFDCDVPRAPSYGIYISQLIRFARISSHSHLADFNAHNRTLTAKPPTGVSVS